MSTSEYWQVLSLPWVPPLGSLPWVPHAVPVAEGDGHGVSEQGLKGLDSHESIRDVLVQRGCRVSVAAFAACSILLIHQTPGWCGCSVTAAADTVTGVFIVTV